MDKNLLLAVALSVLVYVGWFHYIEKHYGAPTRAPATASPQVGAQPDGGLEAPPEKGGGLEGSWEVSVGKLALRIQPLGGSIVSFRYPGPLGSVELVPDPRPGFFSTWPSARFSRVPGQELAFEAVNPLGLRVRKEYLVKGPEEINTLRLTFTNPTRSEVQINDLDLFLGPGLGTVASEQKENARLWSAIALLPPEEGRSQDQLLKVRLKDPDETHRGPWRWLALNNRYFLAAMFPPADAFAGFQTGALREDGSPAPWIRAKAGPIAVAAGGSVALDVPFYLGPKGYTHLHELGRGLERSVEFGYFNRLGRLTLKILRFFHGITGNWGWSIILLTTLLQCALLPLTLKSIQSAAAMRKIQPEVAKLQQKFGKDPKRLNMEMMQLYKKHGANPLGGCLPMLAQMPVFIALFNTLRNAWELHGARWVLWIKDLSSHDPYYILPLVMGGFMFVQNKLNPAPTADPAQAQVMTFMPVLMTFMFLQFPAGLVLYWLTNSVLSSMTQIALRRSEFRPSLAR